MKIVFLSILILNFGCDKKKNKVKFYKLNFKFDTNLQELQIKDPMPSNLVSLMNYFEPSEDDLKCFGRIFAPEISYERTDLNKSVTIGTPLTFIRNLQKKVKTLSPINLKEGYDVGLLTIPKLLLKKNNGEEVKKSMINKDVFILKLNDSKKNVEELKKEIQKRLCDENVSSIIVKVSNEIEVGFVDDEPEDVEGDDDEITTPLPPNPCKVSTVNNAEFLKDDLLKIIDASKSSYERKKIANEIWSKYFTKNAYVAQYLHRNDKNPNLWNPGEGKMYFVNRLAVLESMTDINIFKIETSTQNGKISGIRIVECHNSSESL